MCLEDGSLNVVTLGRGYAWFDTGTMVRSSRWLSLCALSRTRSVRSIADPVIIAQTNVIGTIVLLNVARVAWEQSEGDFGNHKFLQVSTDEVYGSLSLDEPDAFFREESERS